MQDIAWLRASSKAFASLPPLEEDPYPWIDVITKRPKDFKKAVHAAARFSAEEDIFVGVESRAVPRKVGVWGSRRFF